MIDIAGRDGLVLVAKQQGQRFLEQEGWADDGAIKYYQRRNPDAKTETNLEKLAAAADNYIRAYLDAVREYVAGGKAHVSIPQERFTYQTVFDRINHGMYHGIPANRAEELHETALRQLASDAVRETDPSRLARYIRLLRSGHFLLVLRF